jgi:hypothetical protein
MLNKRNASDTQVLGLPSQSDSTMVDIKIQVLQKFRMSSEMFEKTESGSGD